MFWNTNKNKAINKYIVSLVRDYDIDILIMAEYDGNKCEVEELLWGYNQKHSSCITICCNRISIWSNYVNMKSGIQDKHYSIQVVQDKYILCCIHLMSDMRGDRSDERFIKMRQIKYMTLA